MANDSIILNTESQGVIYFSTDQLMRKSVQLSASDYKTLGDKHPSGYSVARLLTDSSNEKIYILSESEKENKTSISIYKTSDSEFTQENEFKIDQLLILSTVMLS